MKVLSLIGCIILCSCSYPDSAIKTPAVSANDDYPIEKIETIGIPQKVPYEPNPVTPLQEDLIKVSETNFDSLIVINGITYQNKKVFSGWAYQIYKDNSHRYRYTKFNAGKKVWQIGYYESGNIDHDFHIYKDENMGSQRMWRDDGSLYIDNYFLEGGVLHGVQKRWYVDNRLAVESKYDKGILIYKREYDKSGNLIDNN